MKMKKCRGLDFDDAINDNENQEELNQEEIINDCEINNN